MEKKQRNVYEHIYILYYPFAQNPQYSAQKDGLRQYSRIEMNKYSGSSEKLSLWRTYLQKSENSGPTGTPAQGNNFTRDTDIKHYIRSRQWSYLKYWKL